MSDQNQFPGTGSIADSVEFVKKLWGIPSAGALPGMLIPTLSLEEINKKIADLKAVESWMAVNMNMLRGTIQALEVQSATIVNLQSMGAMLGGQKADAKAAPVAGAAAFPFSFPNWPTTPEMKPSVTPDPVAAAPSPFAFAAASVANDVQPKTVDAAAAPNPNAWWDLLQNQFKQAVSTALAPEAKASQKIAKSADAGSAPSSASKTRAKAAAKKAPARAKPKNAAAGRAPKS